MSDEKAKVDKRIGNSFWKARSSHGRNPIFEKKDDLSDACYQYFQWVEENPLYEAKPVSYQGETEIEHIPKMRAMTISGLCIFLGISPATWDLYAAREDFIGITGEVVEIIRTQKFEGASADMLNANIIARDLGLRDKQDVTISNPEDRTFTLNVVRAKDRSTVKNDKS